MLKIMNILFWLKISITTSVVNMDKNIKINKKTMVLTLLRLFFKKKRDSKTAEATDDLIGNETADKRRVIASTKRKSTEIPKYS